MSDASVEQLQTHPRDVRWKRWIALAVLLLCGGSLALFLRPGDPVLEAQGGLRPKKVLADGYASSNSCRECHESEYKSWHASYHRTMTQPVSPETAPEVIKDSTVTVEGHEYRFEQQGDVFWVEMDSPIEINGMINSYTRVRRRIVLMTGSHHQHVFWFATETSRSLGVVPLTYLIQEKKWIPRDASFLAPRKSGEILGLEFGHWNSTCCQCHTTHPRPRPRPDSKWDTHVVDFGIACESCHGPGAAHIANHRNKTAAKQHDSIVNPRNLDHRRASQVCGQCHSNQTADPTFLKQGRRFRPGQDPAKALPHLARINDETSPLDYFWPDGMIRISGREYSGLIESPCFQRGKLSCLSCHSLHGSKAHSSTKKWADDQLRADMRGNQACVQCHSEIAKKLSAHTNHAAGSTGSECMNCHMPHTTYGLLKAIRSHQIDSPRVSTAVKSGRIAACNQCHLDRSLEWTAGTLAKWYGQKKPVLDSERKTKSIAVLHSLKGDAGQRALAAWSFGWKPARDVSGTDWMVPYLLNLMNDEYDAVRQIAFRSLRSLPGYEKFAFDPFADAAERTRITTAARDAWIRRNQKRGGPGRPELLLRENGRLDWEEFKRLREQRNRRRVFLQE